MVSGVVKKANGNPEQGELIVRELTRALTALLGNQALQPRPYGGDGIHVVNDSTEKVEHYKAGSNS